MIDQEWNDDLTNDVRILDGQHKLLTGLLGKLRNALRDSEPPGPLLTLLSAFVDGSTCHFATEERLMAAVRYPGFARHKAEHDGLLQRVTEVQRRCAAGQIKVDEALVTFLRSWLSQHIKEADVRLGSFLRSKGVH